MKNNKIVKMILTVLISLILISPNTVEAKKTCKELDVKNTCLNLEYCDGSRCSWQNNKCVNKSSTSSETTSTTTTLSKLEFCAKTSVIWQIVGWVVLVVKIVIPVLLIILGVVDFSKAAVSGKDDEVKKSVTSLMWRTISAVVIFFIPTVVTLAMGLVTNFKDSGAAADFKVCKTCILDPANCDTSKDAGKN